MDALLQSNLPQIRELLLQHGVEAAYAFGSAVKGTRKPNSDMDFVIRFPEKMDFVAYSDNYFSLLYALQELLRTEAISFLLKYPKKGPRRHASLCWYTAAPYGAPF